MVDSMESVTSDSLPELRTVSSVPKPIQETLRKPHWLKKPLAIGGAISGVEAGLRKRRLHTICEEGKCPNRGECFSRKVATLLIMGDVCTRNCSFCAVNHGKTKPLDKEEPARIADQVLALGLRFVVVTSVTRDDLPDGGAGQFARVARELKRRCDGVGVELLVPDFKGSYDSLITVLQAEPDVVAHNVETVPRLHPTVRPQALYERSLQLLKRAATTEGKSIVKSGLMVGLGENAREVEQVLQDLRDAGCQMITIGQYLRPSKSHHPVIEYIRPEVFQDYERKALEMGFLSVASGPFVRSSYLAENFFEQAVFLSKKSGR